MAEFDGLDHGPHSQAMRDEVRERSEARSYLDAADSVLQELATSGPRSQRRQALTELEYRQRRAEREARATEREAADQAEQDRRARMLADPVVQGLHIRPATVARPARKRGWRLR